MSLTDLNTRNGYSPRPGVVHRPTRTSLPEIEGPSLPHAPNYRANDGVAIGAPNPDAYVSVPVRETTTGSHTPVRIRLIDALTAHGHYGDHGCGVGSHVTAVHDDGTVTMAPNLAPAVAECVSRLVARVAAE